MSIGSLTGPGVAVSELSVAKGDTTKDQSIHRLGGFTGSQLDAGCIATISPSSLTGCSSAPCTASLHSDL